MSITFFIVGAVIFAVYMYFTIWNIYYNYPKSSKHKDYPNLGSEGCEIPDEYIEMELKKTRVHDLEVEENL